MFRLVPNSRIITASLAIALISGMSGCRKPTASAAAPSTRTANPLHGNDWIGFHNGGSLLGEASPINAPPMHVRWTFKAGENDGQATATATPTTAPTTAPVYHPPGKFVGGAAIVGGTAYVGDTAGALRAIDIANGKVRWLYHSENGFETTPLVLNGRLLIGDLGGMFHAIDAGTGKQIWNFDSGDSEIHASANYFSAGSSLRIVFATDGADIYCLDFETGNKVWAQKAGDRVYGTPGITGGTVLVSGCDAQLHGIKGSDGTEEFSADLTTYCPGSTAVAGDHLVMGTDQGRVMCISEKTHEPLWVFNGIDDQATVFSSPAIADGIVVVGARDRKVYGLELATGKKLWSFATRGDVDSSPAISGGRVYIGSKDKTLYVLDLKTGAQIWSFTAGRALSAPVAIGDGVLVIGDEGGHLFCLE